MDSLNAYTPNSIFAALADPTRRRLLALLQSEGELCVCELTQATGESQPKISRHLATLKDAGLILPRRAGTWIHYRIRADLPPWANTVLTALTGGPVSELATDLGRLQTMRQRPDRCAA
jgi:ArsR family transcriptional regulator